MKRPGLMAEIALMLALALVSVATAAPTQGRPTNFMQFLESADRSEPLQRPAIERLTGLKLKCSKINVTDCLEAHDVTIAGVRAKSLSFRASERGSILVLEGLSGQCVPVAAVKARFGSATPVQGCTDGHTCWYDEFKRPWGKLSIGVSNLATSRCAQSVILDSFPK